MARKLRKKKTLSGLLVTLSILLVILMLPVGLVYGLLYNSNWEEAPEINEDESFDLASFASNIMVDCLDKTETEHKIEIGFTQNNLNALIKSLFGDALSSVEEYVPEIFMKAEEGSDIYKIVAHGQFQNLFKTEVCITTRLEVNEEEHCFYFRIEDISVGNLHKLSSIAQKLLPKFIDPNEITNGLNSAGFHLEAHLDQGYLSYTKEAFLNDIQSLIGGGESDSMFSTLIGELFGGDSFYVDTKHQGIKAGINLEDRHLNTKYCSSPTAPNTPVLDLNLSEKRDVLEQLIDGNAVTQDHADEVFKFLIHGYDQIDSCDSNIKTYIDSCPAEFDTILGQSRVSYVGEDVFTSVDLANSVGTYLTDRLNSDPLYFMAGGEICSISEFDFNQFLRGTNLIGTTFLLSRQDTNGIKINYVVIDNFYINVVNNTELGKSMSFVLGLNINGYELTVVINTLYNDVESVGTKLVLDVENTYFGDVPASEALANTFYTMFGDALGSGETVSFDTAKKQIVLNLGDPFAEHPEIGAAGTLSLLLEGENIDDENSRIGINLELHI